MALHRWGATARANALASNVASVELIELLLQPVGQAVFPVRLATGWYDVGYAGHTWAASGRLLNIEPTEESVENVAQGASFTISAVPVDQLSLALDAQYAYPGRPVRILKAILAPDYVVADSADVVFAGYIDKMTVRLRAGSAPGEGSASVTIACESKYARLRIPHERRITDAQQRAMYPTDTGLRQLARMREDTSAVFGVR